MLRGYSHCAGGFPGVNSCNPHDSSATRSHSTGDDTEAWRGWAKLVSGRTGIQTRYINRCHFQGYKISVLPLEQLMLVYHVGKRATEWLVRGHYLQNTFISKFRVQLINRNHQMRCHYTFSIFSSFRWSFRKCFSFGGLPPKVLETVASSVIFLSLIDYFQVAI